MDQTRLIWRFGRWIARQEGGAAKLSWSNGEMVIRVINGKIVAIEGIDPGLLIKEIGGELTGESDLLLEATELAKLSGVSETQSLQVAKRVFANAIKEWILDPLRRLEIVEGTPDPTEAPTISITHTIVELILQETDGKLLDTILPDIEVLLRRHGKFLELYSPLRLSEEADLIVAKITGQRTAREICSRSPHGSQEVVRLLAALIATGMLEPVPVVTVSDELKLLTDSQAESDIERRPLPVGWFIAAAFVIVVILGTITFIMSRSADSKPTLTGDHWSLVIDIGCEPEELRRVLEKSRDHPKITRAVKVIIDDVECWRLIWGTFSSMEEAENGKMNIPSFLVRDGFDPHAIKIDDQPDNNISDSE